MRTTNNGACGTSYHGVTLRATPNQLLDVLGDPRFYCNSGRDKVNFDWQMQTDGGKVFTVYDWKEYRPLLPDEEICWHVGGFNREDCEAGMREVLNALILLAVRKMEKQPGAHK